MNSIFDPYSKHAINASMPRDCPVSARMAHQLVVKLRNSKPSKTGMFSLSLQGGIDGVFGIMKINDNPCYKFRI